MLENESGVYVMPVNGSTKLKSVVVVSCREHVVGQEKPKVERQLL